MLCCSCTVQSVKTKQSTHKCCLIKFPPRVDDLASAADSEQVPAAQAQAQSPSIRTSRKRAASRDSTHVLPTTATRCLSLSQFLTLLVQQQSNGQGLAGNEDAELGAEGFDAAPTAGYQLTALERRLLDLTIHDASAIRASELLTDNVVLPSYAQDSPVPVQRASSADSEANEYVVL